MDAEEEVEDLPVAATETSEEVVGTNEVEVGTSEAVDAVVVDVDAALICQALNLFLPIFFPLKLVSGGGVQVFLLFYLFSHSSGFA